MKTKQLIWWRVNRALCVLIISALFGIGITGCKEEGKDEPSPDGNLKATVEISLELTSDFSQIGQMGIAYPTTDDVRIDTVKVGEKYSKSLIYNQLPDTAGIYLFHILDENATLGATVTAGYNLSYKVMLQSGNEVVDVKFVDESPANTFTPAKDLDELHEQLSVLFDKHIFFELGKDKIKELSEDEFAGDTDLTESEPLPEEDEDLVTIDNMLYYINIADVKTNDKFLHDNLLARFLNKTNWSGNELKKGDFLYLNGSEIASVINNATLRDCMAKGVICVLGGVESYDVLDQFCQNAAIHNPITPDQKDISHKLFIIADADESLSDDSDIFYYGFFYALSPTDNNGDYLSDYAQGKQIDQALRSLKEVLNPGNAVHPLGLRNGSDMEDDLTKLTGAYKVFLNESGCNQTLDASQYRDKSKGGGTNVYSVEYDIWNALSLKEKRNYYYIHQEILTNFTDCYKGVYSKAVGTIAKVCEYYGKEVEVTTVPVNCSGMEIHRDEPKTTQSSTTYTSGLSWNLGGSVGVEVSKKGPTGMFQISGGIQVNQSTQYEVHDVTISNLCKQGISLGWLFDLSDVRVTYAPFSKACSNIHEGSLTGRTTLSAGTDYIISFPETEEPQLQGNLRVQLHSAAAKAGQKCAQRDEIANFKQIFKLPRLTSADFAK